MLMIAICDDEPFFSVELTKTVKRYLKNRGLDGHITTFSSGEALLRAERQFDIILMDMKLPGQSGLETAERLRRDGHRSQLIFISSYQEYVFGAFEVDAVHYLIKPISDEKLFGVLDKAVSRQPREEEKTLTISKGSATQIISIRDILYCESINHKIFIYTMSAKYDYFGTLDALSEKLDSRFFRCHRSYIVNLNYVIRKEQDTATVAGGDKVILSRRKQQEFTEKLLTFFRNEVL